MVCSTPKRTLKKEIEMTIQRKRAKRRIAEARRPYELMKKQKIRNIRAMAAEGNHVAKTALRESEEFLQRVGEEMLKVMERKGD